jgi:outer membrane scaffolding protein for murein synthesis (MipA/OmpV family)
MYRRFFIIFFIGMTLIVFDSALIAAPLQEQNKDFSRWGEGWSVRVGALGVYTPAYEGSDDYELKGAPLMDIRWDDKFFFNVQNGLGGYIWNRDDCRLGMSIGYTLGRDEDDSCDLRGLGDIDGGATANVLFEWVIENTVLQAHYEQQITGQDTGFQIHLGLGYDLRVTEKTTVKPSIKATYANTDYMEEYFGISPDQSKRSSIPVYDADSGFKSLGAQIMAIYKLDRRWDIQMMAGYDRLVGEAADSPVVKDTNQYRLAVGVSYEF